MKKLFVFLLLSHLYISNSNAAVISYDESIDGELSSDNFDILSPNYIGVLDIGLNTVSGSTFREFQPNSSDADRFHFSIAAGYQLVSISVLNNMTENVNYTSARSTGALSGLDGRTLANVSTDIFQSSYPNPATVLLFPGFGEGGYSFTGFGGSFITIPLSRIAWDYTVTLEVTPVPLPPAVWLFGSALIGLIGLNRKA